MENNNKNKTVLITAGPTYEPIDPVRYIGNRSSGQMGIALANVFAETGCYDVTLVLGPTNIRTTVHKHVKIIDVETAIEMYYACMDRINADIIICAAAVADYKVVNYSSQKIKKDGSITLELEKNVDILYEIGRIRISTQVLVGFALETDNIMEYARAKITKKNLDVIIANHSSSMNADKTEITIINKDGTVKQTDIQSKYLCAIQIYDYLKKNFNV